MIPVSDRFPGKLTLPEQEIVAVDLEISPDTLTLRADSALIGTWPLKFCRISKVDQSRYRLSVDGEVVTFQPDDDRQFAVVAAQRFRASSLADRINVVRTVEAPEEADQEPAPPRKPLSLPDLSLLKSPLLVGSVAGVIVLASLAWGVQAIFAAVGEPDSPPVTISTTASSAAAEAVGAFDLDPSLFVVQWNAVANGLGVTDLFITSALPRGSFETVLAPLITLQGTTDEVGIVRSFVVVADPTGDPESDELAILSWGVALAVADPTLTERGRSDVLAEMGIDVRNPELGGLDGQTERNGIRYSMQYFEAFSSVLLNISKAP